MDLWEVMLVVIPRGRGLMVEFCYSQIRGVPSMAFRNGIVTRLLQGVMDEWAWERKIQSLLQCIGPIARS